MDGTIDLRIDSIRDIEFFLAASDNVNLSQLGVKIEGKDVVANKESKTVALTTEVRYVLDYDTDKSKLVLKYVNEMTFYIDNFNDLFRYEDERSIFFDKELARFFLDIITPTIRGILFSKTAGTGLSKCYLPLIQADRLI